MDEIQTPMCCLFHYVTCYTFLFFTHGFCAIVDHSSSPSLATVTSNSIEVEAASIMPAATAWKTNLVSQKKNTFPKTNIAPENGWLEYDRFLLGKVTFQVLC